MSNRLQEAAIKFRNTKDEREFNTLYKVSAPYINKVLFNKFKSQKIYRNVDEVVLRTMMIVWEKIEQYNPDKSLFGTWISKIAHNEFLLLIKYRQKNMVLNFIDEDFQMKTHYSDNAPLDEFDEVTPDIDLQFYINLLDEPTRTLMTEVYINKRIGVDVAKEHKLNYASFKTKLRKGKLDLRDYHKLQEKHRKMKQHKELFR